MFNDELLNYEFFKGPYLESTPPFKTGVKLDSLIQEGILNPLFDQFIFDVYPFFREKPLYYHQEDAIRKALQNRNLIITTGTGSGKTECFLFPILSHLLNEWQQGLLGPGIRAIILYPLNALANDQIRRLREISYILEKKLPNFPFTFGRYIGETEDNRKSALDKFKSEMDESNPPRAELLSREEMRDNPPHILITNYAMLEYLLLRPKDSSLFSKDFGSTWRFLVLDEAHVYSGAKGAEIAFLIRRFKSRIKDSINYHIQCFATSATISSEINSEQKIIQFAANIFNEPFEWDPNDIMKQDIIFSRFDPIKINQNGGVMYPHELYHNLLQVIEQETETSEKIANILDICQKYGIKIYSNEHTFEDSSELIYEILIHDTYVKIIQECLMKSPISITNLPVEIANLKFPIDDFISLIKLAAFAHIKKNSISLLPVRFHTFVRSPEGLYLSLFPKKKINLYPIKTLDESPCYEIATCRRCGQEFLIAFQENDKLVQIENSFQNIKKNNKYYMILNEISLFEENEDDSIYIEVFQDIDNEIQIFCPKCGKIFKNKKDSCECSEKVYYLLSIDIKEDSLNKCFNCGYTARNAVMKFYFGKDKPNAVLISSLYEYLLKIKKKKKSILSFSDNRQDAAFFAAYLDTVYNRILERSIIYQTASNRFKRENRDYRLSDLVYDITSHLSSINFFPAALSFTEIKRIVWGWVLREFFPMNKKNSLEDVGLVRYKIIFPTNWQPPQILLNSPYNLTTEEIQNLYQFIFDNLRNYQAVSFPPEAPDPQDEVFSEFNRNKVFYFSEIKKEMKKNKIFSFIPSENHDNSRADFLKKIFSKSQIQFDENTINIMLDEIWQNIIMYFDNNGVHSQFLEDFGLIYQTDHRFWQIIPDIPLNQIYICDKCNHVVYYSIRDICPIYHCDGKLQLVSSLNSSNVLKNNYRILYISKTITPISISEHTAQLTPRYATEIQQKFIRGEINILSCSTTFEMGVDLGDLELIYLKNIPPEPSNYVQRTGRAGRRLNTIGFSLVFCQSQSHDLMYFRNPENIISGRIPPPVIKILNPKIAQRHVNSVILSSFFREYPDNFGIIKKFFNFEADNSESFLYIFQIIKEFLDRKKSELLDELHEIIPSILWNELKIENNEDLINILSENSTLTKASDEILSEFQSLNKYITEIQLNLNQKISQKQVVDRESKKISWAVARQNTLMQTDLIDFLASKSIIPKYGFPVDSVELSVISSEKIANNIRLERDLKLAIAEYAPSSKVIANTYIWESYAIKKVFNREWEIIWYCICENCNTFSIYPEKTNNRPVEIKCTGCNMSIMKNIDRVIVPAFGFLTSNFKKIEKCGDIRPMKEFSSLPFYVSTHSDDFLETDINYRNIKFNLRYFENGQLFVVCSGKKHGGFYICSGCGAGFSEKPKKNEHKTPFGQDCKGIIIGPNHLGHHFLTDVLLIQICNLFLNNPKYSQEFYHSLMNAIIIAAEMELGIASREIQGSIYFENNITYMVIFDNVPGGAGYCREIFNNENFVKILNRSYEIVKNCSCGIDTSCNMCLRNYSNQHWHEFLRRDHVINFFEASIPVFSLQSTK